MPKWLIAILGVLMSAGVFAISLPVITQQHWTLFHIGFAVFGVGLVPFTIGAAISQVEDYDHHNKQMLNLFGGKLRLGSVGPRETPGSKWWLRIGIAICAVGMAMAFAA
jgi:hypothetical protein